VLGVIKRYHAPVPALARMLSHPDIGEAEKKRLTMLWVSSDPDYSWLRSERLRKTWADGSIGAVWKVEAANRSLLTLIASPRA